MKENRKRHKPFFHKPNTLNHSYLQDIESDEIKKRKKKESDLIKNTTFTKVTVSFTLTQITSC